MQCKICKTELVKDESRGCSYCPNCHPLSGVKETPAQELARLEKRCAELRAKVKPVVSTTVDSTETVVIEPIEEVTRPAKEKTYRERAKELGIKTFSKTKEAVLVEIAEEESALADKTNDSQEE